MAIIITIIMLIVGTLILGIRKMIKGIGSGGTYVADKTRPALDWSRNVRPVTYLEEKKDKSANLAGAFWNAVNNANKNKED